MQKIIPIWLVLGDVEVPSKWRMSHCSITFPSRYRFRPRMDWVEGQISSIIEGNYIPVVQKRTN
jgi:hypothetical protein